MSKEIIIRLSSSAGRSRINIPPTASLGDLKAKIQTATGVEPSSQRLAFDRGGSQAVTASNLETPLANLRIVNGTEIHLLGADAKMDGQILTKPVVKVEAEPTVPAAAPASSGSGSGAASSAAAPAAAAGGSKSSGDKGGVDPTKWSDKADRKANFEAFDTFLRQRRYETANLQGEHKHKTTQVKPGVMMKMPPSVSIKQQPYRHVDQLSFYNVPEIQNFMSYWNGPLEMLQQRKGWLFGYYLEDGNYGDKEYCEGTRCVVEGIYEPPQQQIGDDIVLQDNPDMTNVKKVAEALGLELVGHIFTSLPLEGDQMLSPKETQTNARLQHENSTDLHFTKYRLSKFVSCAVRPDPEQNGQPGIRSYMVSDQCVALVRDNMLSEEPGKMDLVVREPQKNELMPTFLVEGKDNKRILTDFFIIPVVDSQPKRIVSLFTHAEFPRENRATRLQQRDDLKAHYKKCPSNEPSWSKFADFHLLLYIAKALDVDTAIQIAECVRDRKEIPEGTNILFESLIA